MALSGHKVWENSRSASHLWQTNRIAAAVPGNLPWYPIPNCVESAGNLAEGLIQSKMFLVQHSISRESTELLLLRLKIRRGIWYPSA